MIFLPILTRYNAQSEDDCCKYNSNFTLVLEVYLTHTSYIMEAGVRFPNITIPQGSTINSATLELDRMQGDATSETTTVYGEDVDDAAIFSNIGDFSGRTKTIASVIWTLKGWDKSGWKSVTVTSIIQEIIERPGWASGNALAFLTDAGSTQHTHAGRSYDFKTDTDQPRLTIDYTVINGVVEPTVTTQDESDYGKD